MKLFENFKKNISLKITLISIICLLLLKQLLILFNVFTKYWYIIDFITQRLFFILCILMLLQSLLNLSFIKDLQEEMSVFNEGPTNKSPFIAKLREYHFLLLVFAYLLYSLAVTYFVNDPLISNLLGLIAFISLILYFVQFVIYTKEYVRKSFKFDKSVLNTDKKALTRGMFTAANVRAGATLCIECTKALMTVAGGLEMGYKLTHGGMNDVSPWRQKWLNKTFPDDTTKIWSESKAATAIHNRALGKPHLDMYDSLGDKIKKSLPESETKK